ncbi:2-amino-4-hydroxy-6-hydroxymethyldihydropteridine diphosphokinase [Amylibacter kogurei]|uniref:2-amino-4-hydroxy-6-hydroxymethyldihydropteridine pyrophosphokinase n=1 Tax=Paramylibacter kogurei TaxID=1889778 RepID=A0A2G5K1A1_9RHOB|nr:2-amino-4-hydroxy-6-hydroxymethyldihydropteridine diphosphokinase [Amylibacter kogurei]PIB23307.1 2-amino-4-hydroxy-6-hydroxymethyldihydropteridine diphosphokinase [Amylibacter kogurei]
MKQSLFTAVAIGSNAFDVTATTRGLVEQAVTLIGQENLKIVKQSAFYVTPAFPKGAGPDFVNAVIIVQSEFTASQLLEIMHNIESKLGRTRHGRWAQRTMDLDLLYHGDEILPNQQVVDDWINLPLDRQMIETPDTLILPHPRIQDRGFVLVPLADVAPDWVHPVFGKTTMEMLDALGETGQIGITKL